MASDSRINQQMYLFCITFKVKVKVKWVKAEEYVAGDTGVFFTDDPKQSTFRIEMRSRVFP